MATALSLGTGRRRRPWPCRAAPARGGKKRAGPGCGCLHFHVHFHHSPRQVRAFSPLFSSTLPYLFILPVLFLAVLAFLVCFGWFTLLYFVSSLLLRKRDSPDSSRLEENCTRDDGEERCTNEEQEARNEAEADGDYYCGADRGTDHSRRAPSCTGTADNPVHQQSGQEESVGNKKEAPAYVSRSETLGLVGKRVTRTVVVICSDYRSAAAAAQSNVKSGAALLLPDGIISAKKVAPEDSFGQQPDAQTTTGSTDVFANDDELPDEEEEDGFSKEQEEQYVSGVSDVKIDDLNNKIEMSGLLLLDPVSESRYATTVAAPNASLDDASSDEEHGHGEDVTKNNNRAEEASEGTTSAACDFSENSQATANEQVGMPSIENSISQEEPSGVNGRTEDEKIEGEDQNSCTLEGGSRRLVRTSQPPWWNLCGVLEVFAGCND